MSYSVFVQKFKDGERDYAPFEDVAHVVEKYGRLAPGVDSAEFVPNGEDICEVGTVGGNSEMGSDGVGFDRPVSGGRLRALVFELLAIDGMCYFELDVRYVLARSDVTKTLPEGLLELCETPVHGDFLRRGHPAVSSNLSIDTDPQQQAAASPLVLVVRSFLR